MKITYSDLTLRRRRRHRRRIKQVGSLLVCMRTNTQKLWFEGDLIILLGQTFNRKSGMSI
jgi:hypothetical protein